MAGGRPSKYTPELLEQARFYLDNWQAIGHQIPSIASLAIHLKLSRETIHAWAKEEEKAEFSDIYKDLLAMQEQTLANKGLSGDFNSTITKLILTKHGYSDKIDSTLGGPDGKPVPVQYVVQPVRPVNPELQGPLNPTKEGEPSGNKIKDQ